MNEQSFTEPDSQNWWTLTEAQRSNCEAIA